MARLRVHGRGKLVGAVLLRALWATARSPFFTLDFQSIQRSRSPRPCGHLDVTEFERV